MVLWWPWQCWGTDCAQRSYRYFLLFSTRCLFKSVKIQVSFSQLRAGMSLCISQEICCWGHDYTACLWADMTQQIPCSCFFPSELLPHQSWLHSLQFAQIRGKERPGKTWLKYMLDPAGRAQGKPSDKTNTLCGLRPPQLLAGLQSSAGMGFMGLQ